MTAPTRKAKKWKKPKKPRGGKKEHVEAAPIDATTYPIQHWSYSAMSMFLRNRLAFKKRYILGIEDENASVTGTIGKACHKAVEVFLGGNDEVVIMKGENAHAIAAEYGLQYLDNIPDHLIDFKKTGTREKMLKTYTKAINWYLEEMPDYDVVSVEDKLTCQITTPDGITFPIPAKGIADLIIRNKKGKLEIIDHKFPVSYTNPDDEDPVKILQAMFLYHLVEANYGEAPERIIFRECKTTQNDDGSQQTREWGIEYKEVPHYFSMFYRLYADCTRELTRPDALFLPNFSDLFDGKNSYMLYTQDLLGVDMSDVEINHATHHVKYMPKDTKFTASTLETSDADGFLPEERVRVKLAEFGIPVKPEATHVGPSVTLYRFTAARGVPVKTIEKHAKDIAVALRATSVRVVAPIPGTNSIGIEVPREERDTVPLEATDLKPNTFEVPIGIDLYGERVYKDLRDMPHLLVAGATGAGKSVFINTILHSLTEQNGPDKLQLVLIDPKRVELTPFAKLPHTMAGKAIYTVKEAKKTLEWLTEEMDRRYEVLQEAGARSIRDYAGSMPYIVCTIDEFADLIMSREKVKVTDGVTGETSETQVMGREIENSIVRLAQMARAIGIHLIIGTQRPSVNVLTGLIKANMPTRVAFMTASQTDSKVILDTKGAEELLGRGDMLFMDPSTKGLRRLQGFYLNN